MLEIKDKSKCCGCHACYNICPQNAIEMKEDEKGFKYPIINKEKCVNCGLCDKVCPILTKIEVKNEPIAYACINKNDKVRNESSSGGIFTLLAENIIEKGGVVFGATFDNEFNVVHCMIENKEELYKLRGSKYVQSKIGDTYKLAKEQLVNGKYVLFTGTPCQIEGLKSYLQKDYDKLYTHDIVCHGVPSTIVWKKYIANIQEKENVEVSKFSFRNKDDSWKNYDISINFKDNKKLKEKARNNIYMQAFLKNICLRDSCYNCSFKSINRISDITLADYWGIQRLKPDFDDDKGTSLVVINSKKGAELFEEIKDCLRYEKADLPEAVKCNTSMVKSVDLPDTREEFFKNIDNMNIEEAIKQYLPKEKFSAKIKRKIKNIIKKCLKLVGLYK